MWSYMIVGYALNRKDEEDFDFNFLTVLLICAKIMAYDQGKQFHIPTIKYGFDSYDFCGYLSSWNSAKCGLFLVLFIPFWNHVKTPMN